MLRACEQVGLSLAIRVNRSWSPTRSLLPRVDKVIELGIEEDRQRWGEGCVAGIEMGARGGYVDDADRWMEERLAHPARVLPETGK